jgi:carbamoyl-phosphate synthase large subunit
MKRNDQESPHQKIITASTENEKTPRSSDKKVKESVDLILSTIQKNFGYFVRQRDNISIIDVLVNELDNISKNIKNFPNLKKKIIISPRRTIEICNNKKKFYNFFKNKKVKLPQINYNGKNIIKPSIGRGGKNIFTTNNKSIVRLFKNNSEYLVQKYIVGTEYSIDSVFDRNNNLIFAIARKRIISQNVCIVGKIVQHQKLLKKIKEISSYLKFYGPINFQFIENKKGLWLIEINPRLSGSIIFSIKSGFNPIILSYRELMNKKIILPKKINYNQMHFRFWESISQ